MPVQTSALAMTKRSVYKYNIGGGCRFFWAKEPEAKEPPQPPALAVALAGHVVMPAKRAVYT